MCEAVNVHSGHEPRIMHFYTDHRMGDNEPTPFCMNLFRIGQERKARLD